jgi:hypothetical protein
LCYEVAVALRSDFGHCGTAAGRIPLVLWEQFRYDPATIDICVRGSYTLESWFELIRQEIDAGRPTWYAIGNSTMGHMIVCDGWREQVTDQFEYHMNYGWGQTSSNAWFVLDNLYCYWVPGDICPPQYENMVLGIQPMTVPSLQCKSFEIDDSEGGGDGLAEPGEGLTLSVTIVNAGGGHAQNVTGIMSFSGTEIGVTTASADFGAEILCGAEATSLSPFEISIDPTCPDPHVAVLEILLTADGGYSVTDSIMLFVGNTAGFSDDMEASDRPWVHRSALGIFKDEWHRETERSFSGTTSWKAGGAGAADYCNLAGGDLITPPFLLPPGAELTFRHWLEVEEESATTAFDAASVWVLTPEGGREQVFPVDGYSHTVYYGYPWAVVPAGTPCFSGQRDWSLATFDLSGLSGVAQIAFHFGSDSNTEYEGWYIDDVAVTSTTCCIGRVGDANGASGDEPTIGDVTIMIDALFIGENWSVIPCLAEADINQSGGPDPTSSDITIGDVSYLIDYLFIAGEVIGLPDCL